MRDELKKIANSFAEEYQSDAIYPAHLFKAMLHKETGLVHFIETGQSHGVALAGCVPTQSLIAANSTSQVCKNLLLHRIIERPIMMPYGRKFFVVLHCYKTHDIPLSEVVNERHSLEAELPHSRQ